MPLESATYLNQLNSANPAPTDLLAQGDDHIRLIKAVLRATFPNITGPVTVTQTDLNGLATLIAGGSVPIGAITAWYGASTAIPTGWHLCDGTSATRSDGGGSITTPDLRNMVIMGAGTVAAQGTSYGAANATATTAAAGSHAHSTVAGQGTHTHSGVTVADHALTISEIPAHNHTVDCGTTEGDVTTNFTNGGASAGPAVTTSSTGGGAAHGHGINWPSTPDGTHTHSTDTVAAHTHSVTVPVYQPAKALHYIMKV